MNEHLNKDDQQWAEAAGQALRASERQLDARTLMRLRAIRTQALAETDTPMWHARWAVPAALAAGVLAWVLIPFGSHEPHGIQDLPALVSLDLSEAEALELLMSERGPEFYQNLDFYLWLEENAGGDNT
ncbi:MAG: hypothetical protein L0Y32_06340 [Nevskiales bacterium]|nr:hypothetical protein [Nevskiales bacterium]